jgi:beta-galactosidase
MKDTFFQRFIVIGQTARRLGLSVLLLGSIGSLINAQEPLATSTRRPSLLLGAAWYPEQWQESRWEADLTLMEAAHIHFVRIGEFAWSTIEPSEGNYKLDWIEHAIRAAERHHIAVVLGTPGAAPPAWLTSNYPETLRTLQTGRKDQHGGREQFNFTSEKYRELVVKVTTKMAERFGHDPNVIGWQIDNELANESYGPDSREKFQNWLRDKYRSLDNLNAKWTTEYWSETYSDWSQIPIAEDSGNPGLLLNWKEFVSDTWRSYVKLHLDAIRRSADPRQIITTNMMGWFDGYDHYTVAQNLDFVSWDDYVSPHLDPVNNGAAHDLMRGLLRKNFWVMETQPGFVNWKPVNNILNKGEVRAMAWHAIGHGSEAVEYWQWRSDLNGQEQYHGTLVGADGTPVPVYDEVQQIGVEFEKAAPALGGTTVDSEVAILHDYNSRWAINWQRHAQSFDPVMALVDYYGPLRALVRSIDVVADNVPLSKYKLVVAPSLNVLTPQAATNLEAYVRAGGHLVLGPRSGMKTEDNALQRQRQPGPLAVLLGARVEQFYALDQSVPIDGTWGSGTDTIWAEQLAAKSTDTQVLMRYGKSNGWLDGQPAAVTRKVGKGSITYIGAMLDARTMSNAAKWMVGESGVTAIMPELPADVDLSIRTGDGRRVWIFTNYGVEPHTIDLPQRMKDVLQNGTVTKITLAQYGVAVLEDSR